GEFFDDVGDVAGVGDERGLGGLVGGGVFAEKFGDVVAHGGAGEAFGDVELVAVLHGLGEAGEDGLELGGGVFLVGRGEEFLGEFDAAAGGAGAVEGFDDLVLHGDGGLADDVAFGLLGGDGDAGVLGDGLLGGGPPFFKFLFADDLGEDDLDLDGGGGLVGVGGEGFDEQLGGVFGDEFGDGLGLGLFADQQVILGEDL